MNIIHNKKVIVVTGGYRGIGYGILELLCQSPLIKEKVLIMTSRKADEGRKSLETLKIKFPHLKENLFYYHLDVIHHGSIIDLKNKILAHFGHVNVLYNNAAVIHRNPSHEKDKRDKELLETFDTNVWGLINTTEELLPLFKSGGHIINMSSRLGQMRFSKQLIDKFMDEKLHLDDLHVMFKDYREAFINQNLEKTGWDDKLHHYGCYGVSKAFVNAYTRILDQRMKRKGVNIKVNAVCPGWCKTAMGGNSAPKSPLQGAETPVWMESFTEEKDDSLSGNFYSDKKIISWI